VPRRSTEASPANRDRCAPPCGARPEGQGDDLSVSKAMATGIPAGVGLQDLEQPCAAPFLFGIVDQAGRVFDALSEAVFRRYVCDLARDCVVPVLYPVETIKHGCCIWTAWIIPIHPSDWTRALFYTDPVSVAPILLPQEATTGPVSVHVGLSALRLLPYPVPSDAAGSGTISSSCTFQRLLVSPAAIAGVRCR
jgi:hypothetical protein